MAQEEALFKHAVLDGVNIHTYESGREYVGSRPTLFFIHGNAETFLNWEEVWAELASAYHIVAFDLPGHGHSGRDWTRTHSLSHLATLAQKLLANFDVEKAVWIGHSLGGGVCLQAAMDTPNIVEALVLVASVGAPINRNLVRERWGRLIPHRPEKWFEFIVNSKPGNRLVRGIIRKTIQVVTHPVKVDLSEAVWKRDISLWMRPHHIIASIEDLRALLDSLDVLHERLSDIVIPCEIVSGQEDPIIPLEVGEMLHRKIPNSHHTRVETGGHMLIRTHPRDVARAIETCVSRL